jgi:hypothetical protein
VNSVDIVIVNWNAGEFLANCVRSIPLAAHDGVRVDRVVVVDNASTDGSADALDSVGLRLTVIRNAENRGFAAACNQGAAGSAADYVLFLNPDTELHAQSLTSPCDFLDAPTNADVGIVGIQLLDPNGRIARSSSRFPTPARLFAQMTGLSRLVPSAGSSMTDWDHGETRDVDQVIGAFFFVRTTVFRELGGFDERFFVYFEELDFSLRARARGFRSVYLSDAQAYHRGCGTTDQVKAYRLFLNLRSRLLYARKHFSASGALAVTAGTFVVEPWARATLHLLRREPRDLAELTRGYAMLLRALPEIVGR